MNDFSVLTPEQQLAEFSATAAAALPHWGLQGADLKLIKFRENAVFEVQHDQQQYALRLHRIGYHSDAALQSELEWMAALTAAGIETPKVIPTLTGAKVVRQPLEAYDTAIQVDLFEWIDGEQLGSVEEGLNDPASIAETYRIIGELAAEVHNQSSGWDLPAGFTRHAWDEHGLAGDNPFWNRFWEIEAASDEQRILLQTGKKKIFADLSALSKASDHYSMIHADLVVENIIVTAAAVKIIDFDDAGFGWHLFELATVLYFLLDEPWYPQAYDALVAGYRSKRDLSDEQLALLPLFLSARGFTYLGWVHTRPETETAQELTPMLLDLACRTASDYMDA